MEQVLVVERTRFFSGQWPQGFVPVAPGDRTAMLRALAEAARFVDRPAAEEDPSLKQLIPYCVVRRGDEVFAVERLPAQGESRLHGLWSLGLGGHINPVDDRGEGRIDASIFATSLRRELEEELILPASAPQAEFVGLLNDESNPVGSVHFGLVHELRLAAGQPGQECGVRETTKMRGAFGHLVGPSRLWQDPPKLETWSTLLLDGYLRPIGDSRSTSSPDTPFSRGNEPHGTEESRHGGTQDAQADS